MCHLQQRGFQHLNTNNSLRSSNIRQSPRNVLNNYTNNVLTWFSSNEYLVFVQIDEQDVDIGGWKTAIDMDSNDGVVESNTLLGGECRRMAKDLPQRQVATFDRVEDERPLLSGLRPCVILPSESWLYTPLNGSLCLRDAAETTVYKSFVYPLRHIDLFPAWRAVIVVLRRRRNPACQALLSLAAISDS
jgi:hypothetical protein